MQPQVKRRKFIGAHAEAPVPALCVGGIIGAQAEAPDTIDDANLAPENMSEWLDKALTKFSDGSAATDVTHTSGHLVCQWHHKRLCGKNRRVLGDCKRQRYSDGRCIADVALQCASTHRSRSVKELEAQMQRTPGIKATHALIAVARSVVAELTQSALKKAQQEATELQAGQEQAAAQKARDELASALELQQERAKVMTAHQATDQCKSESANHLTASLSDSAIPTEALMEVFKLAREAAQRQYDDLSVAQARKWLVDEYNKIQYVVSVGCTEAALAAAKRLWAITNAVFEDKVGVLSKQADVFREKDREFGAKFEELKSVDEAALGAAKAATMDLPVLKDLAMLWAAGIMINAVRERGESHTNH